MTDVTALLQQLGFSEYEARAYLALLQRNPLNGYELAKVSGLPRANVYAVLQKLEERGAVVRLDMPSGVRYAPVAPTELTQRIASRFQDVLSTTQQALEELATPATAQYVGTSRTTRPCSTMRIRSLMPRRSACSSRSGVRRPVRWRNRWHGLRHAAWRSRRSAWMNARWSVEVAAARSAVPAQRSALASDNAEVLAGEIGLDNDALA